MFLRNMWYVAAWSADVEAGSMLARTYLGEPVVLYRTESGVINALMDRCSHRAMPLSKGHIDGDIIRCAYHGLEFNGNGVCSHIPGQERIPPTACVRSYPVHEKDGFIWIWMGNAEKADPSQIISNPEHVDPSWAWRAYTMHVKSNWQLLVDNILDLTHVAYIHANTIGGNPQAHFNASTSVDFDGEKVALLRKMPNSVPPKTYVMAGGFKGNVDRWQNVEYQPKTGNILRVNAGAAEVDTGVYEGNREGAYQILNVHGVTPETETTTHYIWSICTNASPASGVRELIFDQFYETISEDERALQAQQDRIRTLPDMPFVGITSDAAATRARRLLDSIYQGEKAVS